MADTSESNSSGQFSVEQQDGVWFITPLGDLASMNWSDLPAKPADVLGGAADAERPNVVFDMTGRGYFGSYFLGILVRCSKCINGNGGTLALCGVGKTGREVLQITSLDTLWDVYDTRADAVQAMTHR